MSTEVFLIWNQGGTANAIAMTATDDQRQEPERSTSAISISPQARKMPLIRSG